MLSALLVAGAVGAFLFYDHYTAQSAVGPQAQQAGRALAVEVAAARTEVVRDRAEAVGTTLSRQAIEIVALASGRITEIAFEPGQMVEAGAVLVRLEDTIEVADLNEARALQQEAESALERGRRLRTTNNIAEATVVELRAAAAGAQARVDRATQRLEDRRVRAPFAGIVGMRRLDLGARVDTDTVITTLDDRTEMTVEFYLPETYYGQVRTGQPVAASSTSFAERLFDGFVSSVDTRIDTTTRAFRVRASLPNPDLLLPAGLFVLVDVTLEQRTAVVVPEEAIVTEAGRMFVYVADGERARRRDIVMGARAVGSVEIRAGVEVGELVITRGLQRLRDGVAIRYTAPEPAAPATATTAGSTA